MLKIFIYFPLLLITLGLSAQNQATTFSNVVGFTNDGSGNYTSNSGGWNTNMLTSENFIVPFPCYDCFYQSRCFSSARYPY